MKISINIPDDLPSNIIQQYINTIEMQIALISKMTTGTPNGNKVSNLKRGSAKKVITFIADDFSEPLTEFKDYM